MLILGAKFFNQSLLDLRKETDVSKLLTFGFSQIHLENHSLNRNIETDVSKLLALGNKNKSEFILYSSRLIVILSSEIRFREKTSYFCVTNHEFVRYINKQGIT